MALPRLFVNGWQGKRSGRHGRVLVPTLLRPELSHSGPLPENMLPSTVIYYEWTCRKKVLLAERDLNTRKRRAAQKGKMSVEINKAGNTLRDIGVNSWS